MNRLASGMKHARDVAETIGLLAILFVLFVWGFLYYKITGKDPFEGDMHE